MGLRKYVGDYEKQYIIKPNGKPGVEAVYKGKYFRFISDGTSLRATRIRFALLSVIGAILVFSPLTYQSVGAHTMYVALPHVVGLFPLFNLLLGVYTLCSSDMPMIREDRDKTEGRLPGVSLVCTCLYGAVAIAEAVCCAISGFALPDVLYFLLLLLGAICFALLFAMRGALRTRECDSTGKVKE